MPSLTVVDRGVIISSTIALMRDQFSDSCRMREILGTLEQKVLANPVSDDQLEMLLGSSSEGRKILGRYWDLSAQEFFGGFPPESIFGLTVFRNFRMHDWEVKAGEYKLRLWFDETYPGSGIRILKLSERLLCWISAPVGYWQRELTLNPTLMQIVPPS